MFNRAFIPEVGRADRGPVRYPPSLAALAPKLERMRALLVQEQVQKRADTIAFCEERGVPGWSLPEATRPLGDASALAAWIERARPVQSLP